MCQSYASSSKLDRNGIGQSYLSFLDAPPAWIHLKDKRIPNNYIEGFTTRQSNVKFLGCLRSASLAPCIEI